MGYTFTWKDIEKICRKLGMERQGKSSVWTGIGPDGKLRTTTIHSKHKGNVGPGLANEIAQKQLYFNSVSVFISMKGIYRESLVFFGVFRYT